MRFRRSSSLLPRALFLTLVSLPAVSFSAEIGGTTVNTDTTLVDGDTWYTNNNFTINDGALVNIPSGATLSFNPTTNRDILSNSTGTLQIDAGGFFSHATTSGGDNLILNGAVALINNGTYEFTSGGDLQLKNSGSSFTNNGLLLKSGPGGASNDPAYIFPSSTSSGGSFLNMGDITVNAGELNIAGGSSTGGTFTTSGTAVLSFSGRWVELTAVADDSAGGLILINDENPASTTGAKFVADAATTVLNVTGTGLALGTTKLDLNGNTLRNDGLLRLDISSVTVTVQGAGSFENSSTGTFRLKAGALALTSSDLTNNGFLEVSSGTTTVSGTGEIVNTATGTLILQGGALRLDGTNLVNNGMAEYAALNNEVTLTGSGRFINNGVFDHNNGLGTDNLNITETVTFENNGTFDFKERGDIKLLSDAVFENNGLLVKSVAGTDESYILGDTTGLVGTFTAAAGSEVRSNAGKLHIGVSGTSDAAALWTADGGDINLAGEWTGTVTGSSTNGGKIRITDSNSGSVASNLLIGTGGLVFDVSDNGAVWNGFEINTQGNTVSNIDNFFIASSAAKTLSGGGEFLNASGASLSHYEGTITFSDDTILRNQGDMVVAETGGTVGYTGAGSLINDTGATLAWNDGGIDVGTGFEFHNKGTLTLTGNSRTLSGDGVFANDAGGVTNWENSSSISIGTGATYTNDGVFNVENDGNRSFYGAGTFENNGTFNQNATGADNIGWSGTGEFVNNGLFAFNTNNDYDMEGGSTFTNASGGKIQVNSSGSDPAQFFSFDGGGVGTVDNQGTVEVLGGIFRITNSSSSEAGGSQFDDIALVQDNGSGTLTGGTWVANGTAVIDLESFGATSGIDTLGTNAVVELTGANADLVQLSSLTQVDGGLYINEKIFTPGGPLIVGSTGILGGDGTIANNTTVSGLLTPGSSRGSGIGGLSVTGDLGLISGSQINLQLGAALGVEDSSFNAVTTRMMIDSLSDMDPTTEHDSIEVSGVLTLSNMMTIQVTDAGVTYAYGQYFDLLDFASLDGITTQAEADAILSLPDLGSSYNWDTSLFVSKGIIFVVPEPSQAMLLLTGLGGLLLRRKRTS